MDKHAAWLRALMAVVVVLSVTANLLRPAPLGLPESADPSPAVFAAVSLEAVLEAPSEKPLCPCPTEIENADCDDGLCKTIAVSGAASPAKPHPALRLIGPTRDHKGLAGKPELTPPKLFA